MTPKLKLRNSGRQKKKVDINKMIKLYNSGLTMRQIAEKMHISPATVWNRLHEQEGRQNG